MENNPYKPGYKKGKKEEFIDSESLKKDAKGLTAALNILVCFLICGGVGYLIDLHYGVHKWTLPGIILGLFVGFCDFIKFIIENLKEK